MSSRRTRPTIRCKMCRGCGRLVLPAAYWQTLQLMGSRWATTDEVLAKHTSWATERTALINRLNKLVSWGLVGRRRRPGRKHYEWRRYPFDPEDAA